MKPIFSVVMPVYNCADYLDESIRSVISQTFKNWELIIVNDGSTDSTELILEKYQGNDQIKIINQKNSGSAAARNRGFEEVSGVYISLLDADDWLYSNALTDFFNGFSNSNLDFLYGDFILVNHRGEKIRKVTTTPPKNKPYLYWQFLFPRGNPILLSASSFRANIIDSIGGFNPLYTICHDREYWTRVVEKFSIGKLNSVTSAYRRRPHQLTENIRVIQSERDQSNQDFMLRNPIRTFVSGNSIDGDVHELFILCNGLLDADFPLVNSAKLLLEMIAVEYPDIVHRHDFLNLKNLVHIKDLDNLDRL